jgi:hypothetical protein
MHPGMGANDRLDQALVAPVFRGAIAFYCGSCAFLWGGPGNYNFPTWQPPLAIVMNRSGSLSFAGYFCNRYFCRYFEKPN